MGWKYFVGATANNALNAILSWKALPLLRYFPRGKSWLYDVQRFARTRDLFVIFDAGANIGQTTHDVLRFFPNAKIYSFEPVSSSFKRLSQSCCRFPNVVCINQALGSERCDRPIKLRVNSELNSLLVERPGSDDLTGEIETVGVNTVDLYCDEYGIEKIDILKMDVQGWELEVLRGASRMFATNSVRFVYSEIGFQEGKDSEMQAFGDLNSTMASHGFLFCGFYDLYRYGDAKEFVLFGNALYLNPKFHSL